MTFSGHIARKRFAQHWLKDESVLDKIVSSANLQSEDRVLEIGPGRGALTVRLLNSGVSLVHAIELDRDLVAGLKKRFEEKTRFTLREGDVLSSTLIPNDGLPCTKVVANIPYNITGPLLGRLVGRLEIPSETIYKRLVILLQKEVADRILAEPGSSNFSSLSVRFQLLAKCKSVCMVPPRCFDPAPKVDSKVILIEPFTREQQLDSQTACKVDVLLKAAFLSRRKMLKNTLSGLKSFPGIELAAREGGISLKKRPQDLSPSSWVKLSKGWS
tara:strand:+ start:500 stop:1315 length:816 start_codon:yes stop_codon:yes gene_type:complete